MLQELIKKTKEKMEKIIISYENKLIKIRNNHANPRILFNITINYHGILTPIQQLSNIIMPETNKLIIKPYDNDNLIINLISKAINKANLGLGITMNLEENLIKLYIPPLTETLRKKFIKEMWKITEQFKIEIRNERRNSNEYLKKYSNLSEDNKKHYKNEIQKLTDKFIKKINEKAILKEKELIKI